MPPKKSKPEAKVAEVPVRMQSAKERRTNAQKAREADNRKRRAEGQPTPWQEAKAARKVRRVEAREKVAYSDKG